MISIEAVQAIGAVSGVQGTVKEGWRFGLAAAFTCAAVPSALAGAAILGAQTAKVAASALGIS